MKKSAQSLIEYGLILALVAVIAVTVLSKFGKTISTAADKTNTTVSSVSENASATYCDSLTDATDKANCQKAAGVPVSK